MTELLELSGGESVLEIGTGSGYQAAVLAEIAARVYTRGGDPGTERRGADAPGRSAWATATSSSRSAAARRAGPSSPPLTASCSPPRRRSSRRACFAQLAEGGIAVAPVGGYEQRLVRYRKKDGEVHAEDGSASSSSPWYEKTTDFPAGLAASCAAPPRPRPDRFITIFVQDKPFKVEIADTPEKHARGLMFRRYLKSDYGMLFVFADEEVRSFWMKNTLIPLDMIFLNGDQPGRRPVPLRPPLPRRPLPQLHLGAAGALRPGDRRRHGQEAEIEGRR